MKKATFSLILLVILSSCKREFARFQTTTFESYAKEEKVNSPILAESPSSLTYTAHQSNQLLVEQEETGEIQNLESIEIESAPLIRTKTNQKYLQSTQKEIIQKPIFGDKKPKKKKK